MGQGMSEAEEDSDDDGDGKDDADHEQSVGSEEASGVGLMSTAAGGAEEEEPEEGSQDELDPDAIVRQYLQHEAPETNEP